MSALQPSAQPRMTSPPGGFARFSSLYCIVQLLVALNALPLKSAIRRYTVGENPKANFYQREEWQLQVIAADAGISPAELEYAFMDPWLGGEEPAEIDVCSHLRVCPECVEADYHSALFQSPFVLRCPAHGCLLVDRCQHCRRRRPYNMSAVEDDRRPFACRCQETEWIQMISVLRRHECDADRTDQLLGFLNWTLSARALSTIGRQPARYIADDTQPRLFHSRGGSLETLAAECSIMDPQTRLPPSLRLAAGQVTYPAINRYSNGKGSRFGSSPTGGTPRRTLSWRYPDAALGDARRVIDSTVDGLEQYVRLRHAHCYHLQKLLKPGGDPADKAICDVIAAVAVIRELRWAGPAHVRNTFNLLLEEVTPAIKAHARHMDYLAPSIAALLTSTQVVSEVTEVVREVSLRGSGYAVDMAVRARERGRLGRLSYSLAYTRDSDSPQITCAVATAGSLSEAWAELAFVGLGHEAQSVKNYQVALKRDQDLAQTVNNLRSPK